MGAVHHADQIHPLHGRAKADIGHIGKAVPAQPRFFMALHGFGCACAGLLFRGKRLNDHQGRNSLLQKHPQPPVAFLDILVQLFQHAPKAIGQHDQQQPARDQNIRKPPIQGDDHYQRGNQADDRSEQPRQDFHSAAGHNGRVAGEAVQPFCGVGGGYGGILLPQNTVQQPPLEGVFNVRLGQLVEPANDGADTQLHKDKADDEENMMTERSRVFSHRAVHDGPEKQSVNHADDTGDALNYREGEYIAFFSARHPPEPGNRFILFHGLSLPSSFLIVGNIPILRAAATAFLLQRKQSALTG